MIDRPDPTRVIDETAPAPIVADEDWLDWAPGSQPLWRNETPAEMRRRQARWSPWRRRVAGWLGFLA